MQKKKKTRLSWITATQIVDDLWADKYCSVNSTMIVKVEGLEAEQSVQFRKGSSDHAKRLKCCPIMCKNGFFLEFEGNWCYLICYVTPPVNATASICQLCPYMILHMLRALVIVHVSSDLPGHINSQKHSCVYFLIVFSWLLSFFYILPYIIKPWFTINLPLGCNMSLKWKWILFDIFLPRNWYYSVIVWYREFIRYKGSLCLYLFSYFFFFLL